MTLRLHKTGIEFPDGSWQKTAGVNGNRRLTINGDMRIAQRGTSSTGITTSGYYTVDRFHHGISNIGTWSISQDTDVPSGQGFSNSLKLDCTTADAGPASGNLILRQKIEGQMLQHLKKGTSNAEKVTVSFWVKSAKTGTYILELDDRDNTRHICQSYTIDTANTWEKKTLTFDGDTTGAFDNDNGSSFWVSFWLGAGTNFTSGTLATSWASRTETNRAVGQVNLADSTSNYINITGVQLEVGETATDFEHIPFDVELQRCQRYFEKSTSYGEFPTNGVYIMEYIGTSHYQDELNLRFNIDYKVEKRAVPSVTMYGGEAGKWQSMKPDATWGTIGGATHIIKSTSKGFHANCSDNPNVVQKVPVGQGRAIRGEWTSEAEL
jgi:hypothetical protein